MVSHLSIYLFVLQNNNNTALRFLTVYAVATVHSTHNTLTNHKVYCT